MGGGLDPGVAEQLADHGQAFADRQPAAGEAVTQVVEAPVVEPGPRPDALPRVLQVGEMAAGLAP